MISVYDMLGKLLQTIEKTDEHPLIDLSTNSEGIYLITFKNNTDYIKYIVQ